jgi:hypothetical protein
MSTIVTRSGKQSPLTNTELDANFTNLNSDKLESGDLSVVTTAVGTAALAYNSGVFTYTPPDLSAIDLSLYAPLAGAVFTGNVEAPLFEGDLTGAILFKGSAGEALTKGDPVYISGISGNKTVVSKADANDADKMPCFGIVDDTVSLNADCSVVTFGTLQGLDTSSFSEGDELYISDTGTLTTTAPTGEASQIQKIAKVTRSHASAGSIKVMGAGRTNATPNLNDGNFFLGNSSNQAVSADFTTAVRGEISAGTGIGLSGGVISNTAPDQTVALTGGTGISTSGTYPSFTITNDSPDQTVALTGAGATSISGTYPNFTITSTDTTYSLPLSSSSTRGGVKVGYSENGKNYPVELSSEKMYVNVPWTDSDTTYSAGTGITLTGTTFSLTDTNAKLNLSGGTLTGNLTISIPDGGSSPATTAVLDIRGYEGRGAGIKIRDSANSASNANNREWFIGSGYSQSGFSIGYSATGSQSSYTAQNKLSIDTSGNVTAAGTITATGYNDSNWNTAYTYSQVGHIRLDGTSIISGSSASNGTRTAMVWMRGKVGDSVNQINVQGPNIEFGQGGVLDATPAFKFGNTGILTATGQINASGGNSAQWNTAYGWGNHATAGYYPASNPNNYNNYSLPLATNTVRGGIELFSNTDQTTAANGITTTANRTYGIQLNSDNQAVVNVPWSDTNTVYTLPLATSSVRGGVKVGYTENGKNYPVELSSEKMYVNVPWANTTYSVGDGGLTEKNFTTTLKTKLDGIEANATADQTAAEILTAIKTVDGSGSGLDADTVDGLHGSDIVETSDTISGNLNTEYDAQMFSWSTTTTGKPAADYGQGISIVSSGKTHNETNNWITQLGFGTTNTTSYFRTKVNTGSWSDWRTIWNSANDGSGSGLDADLLDGQQGSYYYPASNPNGYTNDQTAAEILTAIKTVDGSGSGLDADTVDGVHESTFMRKTANSALNMANNNITNVNHLTFNDPGANEGLQWLGGNDWRIFESPDNLTNASGNLQFTTGGTRRMTLSTGGSAWTSSQGTLWGASNDGSGSGLDADLLDGQQGSYYYSAGNPPPLTADPTLTLTGDVTGSATFTNLGNATLTATVLNDSHSHSNYTPLDHIRSLGVPAFTSGGGSNSNITTAALIAEIESDGGFDSYSSVFKTSWSYASNDNLTDAGRFTETAGTSWLTWTDNSSDTTRGNITALAIAPNAGGSAGKMFVYNDQGGGYSPGWREIWTSTSDGSGSGLDADLLDGQHGSYYAPASHVHSYLPLTGGTLTGALKLEGGSYSSGTDTATVALAVDKGDYIYSDDGTYLRRIIGHTTSGAIEIGQGGTGLVNSINLLPGTYGNSAARVNGNTIWNAGNDGSGSGLDADTCDGQHLGSTALVRFGGVEYYNGTSSNINVRISGSGDSSAKMYWKKAGTTNLLTLDMSGNLTATGNVTAYSDRRIKENITPITEALSKVQRLTGNTYTRNDQEDTATKYAGLIAQEVEDVLPEAVREADDGIKVLDYNATIALLVESIKELKAEVDDLKSQLENK